MDAFLTEQILEKKLAFEAEEQKKKKKAARFGGIGGGRSFGAAQAIDLSGGGEDSNWYFYLPQAVSQGQNAFQRIWGQRPLQDNWRHVVGSQLPSTPPAGADASSTPTAPTQEDAATASDPEERQEGGFTLSKEDLKKGIPFSKEAQEKAHEALATALFAMGKMYRFEMKKKKRMPSTPSSAS